MPCVAKALDHLVNSIVLQLSSRLTYVNEYDGSGVLRTRIQYQRLQRLNRCHRYFDRCIVIVEVEEGGECEEQKQESQIFREGTHRKLTPVMTFIQETHSFNNMAYKQPESTDGLAKSTEDIQPFPEVSSQVTAPLSKNAQKKAAKAARFAAQKHERRAKEKESKKEKKRMKAQKRAAGELDEEEVQEEEEKKRMMKRARTGAGQNPFGARVCVDLGFDNMMTDKVGGFCDALN
jgi:hypothetical protein